MFNLVKTGRAMFAAAILVLGVLCLLYKDFVVGRPPAWPPSFQLNPALAYTSGAILIVCAIAVFTNRYAFTASLCIAVLILLLSITRHAGSFSDTWLNAFKSLALLGSCLVAAASTKYEGIPFSSLHNNKIFTSGIVMISLFLLMCGYAHFKYAPFVDALIPSYIPFHRFWTYFCGICLFAGGIGLLLPGTRRLAALLSAIMIGGWFILLHIPRFFADTTNTSDQLGVCESFAFAGALFCAAGLLAKTGNKFSTVIDDNAYLGEVGIR